MSDLDTFGWNYFRKDFKRVFDKIDRGVATDVVG